MDRTQTKFQSFLDILWWDIPQVKHFTSFTHEFKVFIQEFFAFWVVINIV